MKALCCTILALAGPAPAQQAEHVAYGSGCRDVARESFAAWFADGAAAAAALNGHSLVLQPLGDGYRATWGGAVYRVPSTAAVALPPSDDGQTAITPSQPLPTPQGPLATLYVHSNGFVSAAASNDGGAWNVPANDYLPSPHYRNAPATAFWAWHDWNPAEPGSGAIVREEVLLAGERTLCITWRDVENFPTGVPNRGTFQFQFGLASGRVAYVWVHVDADTSSVFGSAHLIGYSPGGPSLDRGLSRLPDDLPLATAPDQQALSLTASPPPVSTTAGGTTVAYTIDHVPPAITGHSVRLGLTALSLTSVPGVDLAMFGAAGCRAYIGSLDMQFLWTSTTATATACVDFPPGLPDGLQVFVQSLALVDAAVPGQAGMVTSNGLLSHVAAH